MLDLPVATARQLASVLRGLRTQTGLTQRQAGSRVGLLPKTISALESDAGPGSIASLFKLLSALEVEMVLRPKREPGACRRAQDW